MFQILVTHGGVGKVITLCVGVCAVKEKLLTTSNLINIPSTAGPSHALILGPKVKGQGHTVTKTVTLQKLSFFS